MITAYLSDNEIIPYESVEFCEPYDGGEQIMVHMAESKKEHLLMPDQAKDFFEGYKRFLEVKEVMMGIIADDDGKKVTDDNQLDMPLRRNDGN